MQLVQEKNISPALASYVFLLKCLQSLNPMMSHRLLYFTSLKLILSCNMSNIYYIIVIIDQFIAPNRRAIDLILFVWDYPANFSVFP